MYWQEDGEAQANHRPPEDVFDLAFRIQGKQLAIDHAFALASALCDKLDVDLCSRIGVHQIRVAESGNGWSRPDHDGASMLLSKRVRLVIRANHDDREQLDRLCGQTLEIDGEALRVGENSVRQFSTLDTLFARSVVCDAGQPEEVFLGNVAAELGSLGIEVKKMLCGTSGLIHTDTAAIFTRSLLVAGLRPHESIALQRHGIGGQRLLGCGLFVAHKGIDAIDDART